MNSVATVLADLIQKKTGVRPQPDDSFATLEVDSLAMAELTAEVEKEFEIRVREDVMDVTTVGELAAYIERQMAARDAT